MVDNCLNADSCPFTCAKAERACICAETCSRWADPSRYGNNVATSSVEFLRIGNNVSSTTTEMKR